MFVMSDDSSELPTKRSIHKGICIEARPSAGSFQFVISNQELGLRHHSCRRFLFVNKVMGSHCPVNPNALSKVTKRITEKSALKLKESSVIFIAMTETVALGRRGRRSDGPLVFEFSEVHSHATVHAMHLAAAQENPYAWFQTASKAIIVNVEATTAHKPEALAEQFRLWRDTLLAQRQSITDSQISESCEGSATNTYKMDITRSAPHKLIMTWP
jgi:hypothetical protein